MNIIDLSDSDNCPLYLDYFKPSPKVTPDGIEFTTYHGLRMYWITGSLYPEYLSSGKLSADIKPEWIYLDTLYSDLEEVFRYNLEQDSSAVLHMKVIDGFSWNKVTSGPTSMWLEILYRVKDTLIK